MLTSLDENEPPGCLEGDGRDKPLRLDYRMRLDALAPLLRDLPRKQRVVAEAILADVALERICSRRWVSYSRNRNHYADVRKYSGSLYTYALVTRTIDFLARSGLVDHWKAPQHHSPGRQSVIRAGPVLTGLLDDCETGFPAFWKVPGETIWLRDDDKRALPYKDTGEIVAMRRRLLAYNEMWRSLVLWLDIDIYERRGPLVTLATTDGRCYTVNEADIQLYRVFNGNFKQGGRLVGGFWQSLSKRHGHRPRLTIDAEPTAEHDHAYLFPSLLYGEVGQELDHDPYIIDGWSRPTVKRATNALFNTEPKHNDAVVLAGIIGEQEGVSKEVAWKMREYRRRGAQLKSALEARHALIRRYFGSGVAKRLMRVESDMADRTIGSLMRQGIPVLPVHDSFIVAERHLGNLEEVMANEKAAAIRKLRAAA